MNNIDDISIKDLKIWNALALRHGRSVEASQGLIKFIITRYDEKEFILYGDYIETLKMRDRYDGCYPYKDFGFRNRYKWPWEPKGVIGKTLYILQDGFYTFGDLTELNHYNEAYIDGIGMTTNFSVKLGDIDE